MAGVINRSQLLKQLLPGLNGLFGLEYKQYEEQHKMVFEIETSNRSFEEELKLSGFGLAAVKDEGDGFIYDSAQEAFTARYTHETVALGFRITEEAMDDNLYDTLSSRYTKALARSMSHTKQIKCASVVNNGFDPAFAGGDGQSLFSTAHPLVGGGTNSNRPTTGTDLNETAIENALIQIGAWTDERGLLINARGVKLILPPALEYVGHRLLKSTQRVGTADNDINAINSMSALPQGMMVYRWLTDPNAWFIKTDVPGGLKHFVRKPMKTAMEGDFETSNVKFKAWERYATGWTDPLGVWGSPGSS